MFEFHQDASRLIISVAATWVLFVVFACSAIAFIGVIFGWLKPDRMTKLYLFALFSVSTLGIFVAAATGVLQPNPASVGNAISNEASRQTATDFARTTAALPADTRAITVFTQITSAADRPQFDKMRAALQGSRFILPAVEAVGDKISANQIRYCDPATAGDAAALAGLLQSKGVGTFDVRNIGCKPGNYRNIVEVWLRTAA